jgi:4-amino-4-deoxy-L-arabinose transferase-like glycosyltransferase
MQPEPHHPAAAHTFTPRRWAFLTLCAVFFGGLLVMLPNYQAYFFGNEHYYTDSAIRMLETGNYMTPVFADGTPRFNKPVLSYWMILGGFRLFGVSVLASRIPSLLAGLGVLILTGLFARRLFGSRSIAFTAMLILASNIEFITASTRATPDIFLCFAVLLSLFGFRGLLLEEQPGTGDAWCAYLGAGLAIGFKGSLGIVIVVFALLFALASHNRKTCLRNLIQPLPMLVGCSLGMAWFIAISISHGSNAMQGFVADQVGNRLSRSPGEILGNLLHYTFGLAVFFFPWSFLLAEGAIFLRPQLKRVLSERSRTLLFLLGWYAILLVVFTPANLTRMRYMLPGFPVVAISAAVLVDTILTNPAVKRLARVVLQSVSLAGILCAVLLAVGAWFLRTGRLGLAALALALLAIGQMAALHEKRTTPLAPLLGLAPFVLIWTFQFLIRPVFPSTPAYELADALRTTGVQRVVFPSQNATVAHASPYQDKYAGHLRLIAGGGLVVERRTLSQYLTSRMPDTPVICIGDDRSLFPLSQFFSVNSGSFLNHGIGAEDIRVLLAAHDKKAVFESFFTPCYIMFPATLPDKQVGRTTLHVAVGPP